MAQTDQMEGALRCTSFDAEKDAGAPSTSTYVGNERGLLESLPGKGYSG